MEGHTHWVRDLLVHGKHLLSCSLDRSICVWNVRSGELYHRQTDYYEEDLYINGLHLVHGGARIFASFFCGSQCVWSV